MRSAVSSGRYYCGRQCRTSVAQLAKYPHFTQNPPGKGFERYGLVTTLGYGGSPARTMVSVVEALSVDVLFRVAVTEIVAGFGILAGAL